MGISTKRAKRIVQHMTTRYVGDPRYRNSGYVVFSDDPDVAVVWDPATNVILTVLLRTSTTYERDSAFYTHLSPKEAS